MVGSQPVEILLVESGDQGAQWLYGAFEATGLVHVVRAVPDIQAAMHALRGRDPITPSLIILDLQRPGVPEESSLASSLEALGELKGDPRLRSIPVVITTSSTLQADVLNAYSHGASSFVCKPDSPEEQRTLISRFSQYWVHVAELPRANPDPSVLSVRTLDEITAEFQRRGGRPIDVLVVDDSEDDVVLLKEAFRDCPMIEFIGIVEDGEQALRFLRRQGEFQDAPRPGLVLMDINMPRKNGFEVLTEMRSDKQLSNVPVVMLTTSKQESDILRAYEGGACSFIAKPVSFDTMKTVARQFAMYWTMVANVPNVDDLDAAAVPA